MKDLTKGKISTLILGFAIPVFLGNLLQLTYSLADTRIVGSFLGERSLAAVGATTTISNLIVGFLLGLANGFAIITAQKFGAGDKKRVRRSFAIALMLGVIVSAILILIGTVFINPILGFLNVPGKLFIEAKQYILIIIIGLWVTMFYDILMAVMRAIGDTLTPLLILAISVGLNIVLDLLFVAVFDMGVAGVALATVIAQFVSAVLCLWKLMHMKEIFEFRKHHLKMSREHTAQIIRLGLPSGLTQAIFSMAMIIVQSLTNSFGEMFIAANVIIMRVDGFAMMPNFSFGTAMTTYAGQNAGAKQYDRINRGAKQGTLIAMGVSAAITGLILIFGKYLMGIFTETEELVDLSMRMMRILAVGYIAMGATQCLSGVMRGAGDTMTPMWISLVTTVLIRVPVAYGISWITRTAELPNGRSECVFISLLCSWVLGALITFYFYKRGKWKKKALGSMEK